MNKKLLSGSKLEKDILLSINNIQPVPQILQKAKKIIANPTSPLRELTDLIETEQSITMRVLKLANSAFYCRRESISSVHDAALVLGLKTLSELILVAFASKPLDKKLKGYDFESQTLWEHSLSVAYGSQLIVSRNFPELSDEAFTAGLIHDVGKVILDKYVYERKELIHEYMEKYQVGFYKAIKKILGFSHADIAARICEKWNFSPLISESLKYHHRPHRSKGNSLAYVLNVADQLSIWIGMDSIDAPIYVLDSYFEKVHMKMDDVEPIMNKMIEYVTGIIEKFDIEN